MSANGRNRVHQFGERFVIDYTPAAGNLAGVTLQHGSVGTHPEHGRVVIFACPRNQEAARRAGARRGQDLTFVVATRPDLAALADEAEALRAARDAEEAARAAAEQARRAAAAFPVLALSGGYLVDAHLCWAAPPPESERARYADWCRDRIMVPVEGPDHPRVTVSSRSLPAVAAILRRDHSDGQWGYGESALYRITPAGWAAVEAEMRAAADAQTARDAARRAGADARRADCFRRARESGTRVELARWTDDCDGSVGECSTDLLTDWANPDGTATRTRTHAF